MPILMRRTLEPLVCACCGRAARGLGIFEKAGNQHLPWVCGDVDCIQMTDRMARMQKDKLNEIETRALGAAVQKLAEDMLKTSIEAMWEAGARNLEAVTAPQLEAALDRLVVNGDTAHLFASVFEAFGLAMAEELKQPPF
jgi:hypothetical protein